MSIVSPPSSNGWNIYYSTWSGSVCKTCRSGGASSAPPTAAAPPPRAWAWDPRDGLLVVARRLQEDQLGSPESSRGPEYIKELNISCTSLLEEREREESCSSMETPSQTPLSYAAAAARADTPPVAADPGVETPGQAAPTAEERTEVEERKVAAEAVLVFRPPPTPPPWSKFFSSHHKRVLCTECFAGNREICNAKCSDCYRTPAEEAVTRPCPRKESPMWCGSLYPSQIFVYHIVLKPFKITQVLLYSLHR
jgi:hypothetical protein